MARPRRTRLMLHPPVSPHPLARRPATGTNRRRPAVAPGTRGLARTAHGRTAIRTAALGWPARSTQPWRPSLAPSSRCVAQSDPGGARHSQRRLARRPPTCISCWASHVRPGEAYRCAPRPAPCRPARPPHPAHVGHRGAPLVGTEAPTILSPRWTPRHPHGPVTPQDATLLLIACSSAWSSPAARPRNSAVQPAPRCRLVLAGTDYPREVAGGRRRRSRPPTGF